MTTGKSMIPVTNLLNRNCRRDIKYASGIAPTLNTRVAKADVQIVSQMLEVTSGSATVSETEDGVVCNNRLKSGAIMNKSVRADNRMSNNLKDPFSSLFLNYAIFYSFIKTTDETAFIARSEKKSPAGNSLKAPPSWFFGS